MVELKARKFGNSLGVVLPKQVTDRLHVKAGDSLFLIEAPGGGYLLTAREAASKAEDIIGRYSNTLRLLS